MIVYDIPAVAELLGVSPRTVNEWVDSGDLRAINVSRSGSSHKQRRRVLDSDLQAFLAKRTIGQPSSPHPRRKRVHIGKEYV